MTDKYATYRLHVDIEVQGRSKATAMHHINTRLREVTNAVGIAMLTGTFGTDCNHDASGMFELREVWK